MEQTTGPHTIRLVRPDRQPAESMWRYFTRGLGQHLAACTVTMGLLYVAFYVIDFRMPGFWRTISAYCVTATALTVYSRYAYPVLRRRG